MPSGPQLELFGPAKANIKPAQTQPWRSLETGRHTIHFVLKRSNRRTIGLRVNDAGLQVTAPHWASLADIDRAVVSRSRWIQNRLAEVKQHLAQQDSAQSMWAFGGKIPYMGQLINLAQAATAQPLGFTGRPESPQPNDRLLLPLPKTASAQRIQDASHAWLQSQARWWFGKRLDYFLVKSGQHLESWALSSATTRWGSCTSARRIRLNWRLIHFSHALIDYVVAHEVAHLSEMNHSPAFWKVVHTLLPDYESARQQLRRYRPGVMPWLADS